MPRRTMNLTDSWCGMHSMKQAYCDCAHHCTGCPNSFGGIQDDCCSCCAEHRYKTHRIRQWGKTK